MKLFKFRSINKNFIDSLVMGTIYFSTPKRLNDPFDCKIDIKKSIIQASGKIDRNAKEELLELIKNNLFVRMKKGQSS